MCGSFIKKGPKSSTSNHLVIKNKPSFFRGFAFFKEPPQMHISTNDFQPMDFEILNPAVFLSTDSNKNATIAGMHHEHQPGARA